MQYPSFVRASSGDAQLSLGEPMNASRDDKESGAVCRRESRLVGLEDDLSIAD